MQKLEEKNNKLLFLQKNYNKYTFVFQNNFFLIYFHLQGRNLMMRSVMMMFLCKNGFSLMKVHHKSAK